MTGGQALDKSNLMIISHKTPFMGRDKLGGDKGKGAWDRMGRYM